MITKDAEGLERVQKAMKRLGFTIAAQNLCLNWPYYGQQERDIIISKWMA